MKLKSKNLLKVINNLKKIAPSVEKGELCMAERYVSSFARRHLCGSVHCIAGWYFLSKVWEKKTPYLNEGRDVTYGDGLALVAEDLFDKATIENSIEIDYLMSPYWWKKIDSFSLFYQERAYLTDSESLNDVKLTWDRVVDRWEQAYNNLKKEEDGEDIG